MKGMGLVDIVVLLLVIVGGINWGLVGAFNYDVVAHLFGGSLAIFARVVYVLVGLAAVYMLYGVFMKGKRS